MRVSRCWARSRSLPFVAFRTKSKRPRSALKSVPPCSAVNCSSVIAEWSAELESALAAVDCVLLDGTFWSAGEMGLSVGGTRSAAQMGHLPISGAGGFQFLYTWLSGWPSEPGLVEAEYDGGLRINVTF